MRATVAGAPVSFGVFELTPEGAEVVTPDDMVEALAETGYAGIDLGPVGYLGRGRELRDRLAGAGLELAGGWIQLPLSDDDAFQASLPELAASLRVFQEAAEAGPTRLPLPTLADAGSATRAAAPAAAPRPTRSTTPRGRASSATPRAPRRSRAPRASSRPSTTTRARSWSRPRRSTGSSTPSTWGSRSTPATS
ncbi:hypothetical protein BC477_17455 [Clavibacter michiganensis subsp. michiganensis]|uniref:Xylose isomerase-like TIM barrel n=1 Tax=Clavibacter michiganensis subsp. michiganensis TaxID=33013 RepID=A0A251XDL6_CLAMM|nr:hypothetical protein BC477_17455 [Clavibacter michiganensis subsp. michiganensis]OUE00307.1 hypothetical protein CMMCAS07_18050 [Clavibacter michiganensis subsp. michiganensis]